MVQVLVFLHELAEIVDEIFSCFKIWIVLVKEGIFILGRLNQTVIADIQIPYSLLLLLIQRRYDLIQEF